MSTDDIIDKASDILRDAGITGCLVLRDPSDGGVLKRKITPPMFMFKGKDSLNEHMNGMIGQTLALSELIFENIAMIDSIFRSISSGDKYDDNLKMIVDTIKDHTDKSIEQVMKDKFVACLCGSCYIKRSEASEPRYSYYHLASKNTERFT